MMKINLKEGDVVLFKNNKDFIGNAIEYITKCEYVHVGIVYKVKDDGNCVLAEALGKGFIKTYYKINDIINNDKYLVLKSCSQLTNVQQCIDKYLGTSYGFLNLIRILIQRLFKITLIDDGNKHLICSEAVAKCLYDASGHKIDFCLEYEESYDYITPAMIKKSCQLYKP